MRIGIDCRLWNETGVGRYTRNLVTELAKIDQKNQYVLFFRQQEFTTVDIPGINFEKKLADIRWHSMKEQTAFARILNQENLELAHFPYFSVPLFYRKPFVITIHDLILNHFPTGAASTLPAPLYWAKHIGYRFIIAQAAQRAKKIITVSESTKKEIIDHLSVPTEKIEVIYEGVDAQIVGKKQKNKFSKEKYFLYVGNAYPHKNLEMLVDAFYEFAKKHPESSLILVGKEDYFYKKLKNKILQMNLQTKILLYGYATDEELSDLYTNAVAFVYPSKMEGFGLPLVEALAHNCPVIASDIPVFKEVAQDAVVYFNINDFHDLVKQMELVYSGENSQLQKIKEKGTSLIKKFSWEKMAKETLAVYNAFL